MADKSRMKPSEGEIRYKIEGVTPERHVTFKNALGFLVTRFMASGNENESILSRTLGTSCGTASRCTISANVLA